MLFSDEHTSHIKLYLYSTVNIWQGYFLMFVPKQISTIQYLPYIHACKNCECSINATQQLKSDHLPLSFFLDIDTQQSKRDPCSSFLFPWHVYTAVKKTMFPFPWHVYTAVKKDHVPLSNFLDMYTQQLKRDYVPLSFFLDMYIQQSKKTMFPFPISLTCIHSS